MAARWGAGEETLTECNLDFFPLETLDEAAGLSCGESVQSCIDPSILSIFEDMPALESKGLDEESEATLLTALTEILDNVGDENLSPFDTLPDSDLLSKAREHSPLTRIVCLSRSPQKDPLCNTRPLSRGKSLSRMQGDAVQRSDGEEEEDSSFTLSPDRLESSGDLAGWEGLPLPLPDMLEHEEEDGLSVSLGDLVRHMHPYCMAISVENEEGEQMLPQGGIVLEVVDQGENGEPILAIPNMDFSYPVYPPPAEDESKEAAEDELADCSEHIVVDDDDDVPLRKNRQNPPAVTPVANIENAPSVRKKKERKRTSPSRRKKKCKEKPPPEHVEGRVLRSGTISRVAAASPKKPEKGSGKGKAQKSQKVPSTSPAPQSCLKPEETKRSKTKKDNTTAPQLLEKEKKVATTLLPQQNATPTANEDQLMCSATAESSQKPIETPKQPASAPEEKSESPSSAPSVSLPVTTSESPEAAAVPKIHPPISITPMVPEPKPKSLSLEEYRRLRQQKKPTPVENQDKSITKWPCLQELPKELPPIPHLPDPNPRDPRRAIPHAAKKEVEEVKPVWQPRGPCVPPTPEALLQPPAYMISSSRKSSSSIPVSKPQQTQDSSKLLQKAPTAAPQSANTSATYPNTLSKPTEPFVPQCSGPPAGYSADEDCSPPDSGRRGESQSTEQKSAQDTKTCPETTTDLHKPAAASGSVPSVSSVTQKMAGVTVSTSLGDLLTSNKKCPKPPAKDRGTPPCSTVSVDSHDCTNCPSVIESRERSTTAMKPQRAKSDTQELIESFTSEIGIEAADLTSLLEQFEETQAKTEKSVPEVSGRAAAVGNSSVALVPEKAVVERVRANDLSHTAALPPKTTPAKQMWKPLACGSLQEKTHSSEPSKSSPSKVIQIEAQRLPLVRSRSKATPAAASVAPDLACMDHDYCLFNQSVPPGEPGKRWNVKQQSVFTIKPLKHHPSSQTSTPPIVLAASLRSVANAGISSKVQDCAEPVHTERKMKECPVIETPDGCPPRQDSITSPRRGPSERSYRRSVLSRGPSPTCSPKERTRGRSRKRFYRSPSPASSCSEPYSSRSRSRSKSPAKKRFRHRNSDSSLSSSSRSSSRSSPSLSRSPPRRRRYSYSSSRSGSWSRSRSRSLSPQRPAQWSRSRALHSPSYRPRHCPGTKTNVEEAKRRKEKAIEERRIVYVGRIRGSMTQRELRERFSLFGEIEECTLHFREHGDNYGFVTYYNTKDAFTAIENGSKLRKPDELPFDLCFGGRRQFCQSSYADLDSNREYEPLSTKGKYHALDFDTLLKQAQQNLKR